MDPEPDYVARVIAARCPEVCDFVVPISVVEMVVEVIDLMQERVDELALRAAKDGPRRGDAPHAA
jgi:hypothetical protein